MKKEILQRLLTLSFILFLVFIFSCKQGNRSSEIQVYLTSAIDSIQNNALMSSKLDWESVRKEAFEEAEDAETIEQTYEILKSVLQKLDDNHSFLQKNETNISYPNKKEKRKPSPYGLRMKIEYGLHQKDDKTFARIFVPQGMRDNAFAQDLQDKILELSSQNPCGWIVDLRGNGGGNMWPMLAGIGVLVGSNPLGGSENGNRKKDFYHYDKGKALYIDFNGKKELQAQAEERVKLLTEEIPIAFLIDRGTASSGEALAVILAGRKNSRSFGEKTYGASTATRGIKLIDSLNLVIAVSTFQDRNGKLYLNGVNPDTEIPIGDETLVPNNDPVIEAAIAWLSNHQGCNN
jgi:carboxyl-terminal processing protease